MVGKLDQGIQLFLSALHRISQTRGGQCLEVAWLHNSIGILYDQQDLTELAASTQLRAFEIQQKHLPPDHKCVSTIQMSVSLETLAFAAHLN